MLLYIQHLSMMHEEHSELLLHPIIRPPNNNETDARIVKIFIILISFCVHIPFIVCDYYYSYVNCICLHKTTNELLITMQNYLQVSCYTQVSILLSFCVCFWGFHPKQNNSSVFIIIYKSLCVFSLLWNITGFILFWKIFYKNSLCNTKNITMYLFVTFVIKLIGNFVYINKFNK